MDTNDNNILEISSVENITVTAIKAIEEKLPNVDEPILDYKQVIPEENNYSNAAGLSMKDPLFEEREAAEKEKKKKGRPSSWKIDNKVSPRSYLHLDEESLKVIRSKCAQHQRVRRAKETPEQKADRVLRGRISLMKHRLLERLTLSEEELNNKREELKEKARNWQKNKMSSMTPEQYKEFWRNKIQKQKYYVERASVLETPEEFSQRRVKERQNSAKNFQKWKAHANSEQIQKLRARQRKYRESKQKRHQAMKEIDKLLKAHLKGK